MLLFEKKERLEILGYFWEKNDLVLFILFIFCLEIDLFFYLSVSMNRPMCISFVAKVGLLDATFFSEYRQKLFRLSKEFKNSLLASNSSTVHHSVP